MCPFGCVPVLKVSAGLDWVIANAHNQFAGDLRLGTTVNVTLMCVVLSVFRN